MIYARRTTKENPMFKGRVNSITSLDEDWKPVEKQEWAIPDSLVLCNGCNQDIAEGYLIFLDKAHLKANQCYDIYCEKCMREFFPKVIVVG